MIRLVPSQLGSKIPRKSAQDTGHKHAPDAGYSEVAPSTIAPQAFALSNRPVLLEAPAGGNHEFTVEIPQHKVTRT